jgi:chromosome transmission fidelity protein 1
MQHEEYYLKMKNIGKIADLEEIKAIGKSESFCPYFYEKHCKNKANLILMPYTYLLDEKSSEDIGSLLQNSVVIFDEGHNIPNACESSK